MSDLLLSLLLLLVLLGVVVSAAKQWWLRARRFHLIRELERARGSRVITLIHRQERLNLLGIPILRYLDVDDAERILRAIRWTPASQPIDVVLHTPGGLRLPTQQVAYALRQHPARVTVMVPHYAMSGGTLLTLAASEVLMDGNAVLGSTDPQIQRRNISVPAASVLAVLRHKPLDKVDDETLMLADIATKGLVEMRDFARYLLERTLPSERAAEVASALTSGRWTHDYPLPAAALQALGLTVCTEVPRQVYQLMELYPQPRESSPSVQFIPEPYRGPSSRGPSNSR